MVKERKKNCVDALDWKGKASSYDFVLCVKPDAYKSNEQDTLA